MNEWIGVEDRLPDERKTVLCLCKNRTVAGGTAFSVGSRYNGCWFLQSRPGMESYPNSEWDVISWLPIPEPPKEENNHG